MTGEPLARRDHLTRRPPSNSSPHDLRSPRSPPILAAASQRKPMTEIMDRTAYQRPSSFSEVRPRPDASSGSIDDGLPHARFSFLRAGRRHHLVYSTERHLEPPTDVFHRARSRAFLSRLDPIRPPDASRRTRTTSRSTTSSSPSRCSRRSSSPTPPRFSCSPPSARRGRLPDPHRAAQDRRATGERSREVAGHEPCCPPRRLFRIHLPWGRLCSRALAAAGPFAIGAHGAMRVPDDLFIDDAAGEGGFFSFLQPPKPGLTGSVA